jgi:hypothetical protein
VRFIILDLLRRLHCFKCSQIKLSEKDQKLEFDIALIYIFLILVSLHSGSKVYSRKCVKNQGDSSCYKFGYFSASAVD